MQPMEKQQVQQQIEQTLELVEVPQVYVYMEVEEMPPSRLSSLKKGSDEEDEDSKYTKKKIKAGSCQNTIHPHFASKSNI